MVGIYVIRNKVNDKVYIGQSWNIKSRLADHKRDLRKNKAGNIHLQRAYNKYGLDNFEFKVIADLSYIKELEPLVAQKILDDAEKYWIEYFGGNENNNTYNIREGGWGGKYSEEHKIKMSEARKGLYKGELNPMYGKHHTEETKSILSEKNKGKKAWNLGIPHSEETKQKISKANKGRIQSSEEIEKRTKTMQSLLKDETFLQHRKEGAKKAALKNCKYTDDFVLKLREENNNGISIKKLSIKYNIPFESCRIMIKGEQRYANIK